MSVLTCLDNTRPLGEAEKGGEQQDESHLQWPSVADRLSQDQPIQIPRNLFFSSGALNQIWPTVSFKL